MSVERQAQGDWRGTTIQQEWPSVLDKPCECTGDPPTYEYRKDKRQHCMWCDGLAKAEGGGSKPPTSTP
jgi:hypothetical protein